MTFKILCCDGGGIRGLITALLIQDLDQRYGVIAKSDGFAGTSTGGLIALALANDVPISKIVDVYENDGSKIFEPNGWLLEDAAQEPAPRGDLEAFGSGPGIMSCQYKNDGLIGIAKQLLGDRRLSDIKKYVATNTARLWDGTSWEPTTLSNSPNNPYAGVKMRDAALATSAAPTYFPPYEISPLGFFADGGTFANNPTMTAIADALAGSRLNSVGEVRALSLGTGIDPQGIPPASIPKPLDWGVTHWMWPWKSNHVPASALLNLMMACTSQAATSEATQLLADQFCRGNVTLPKPIALDDWKMVGALKQYTEQYMGTSDWQRVRSWVAAHWV